MIISRTPFRLSFFGGGTDYPAWFKEHGGAVLATTINKYCYLTCRYLPPFFEHKSRIVWSEIEHVLDHGSIAHPVIREILQLMAIEQGVEIHHNGDLPARSGLGSSSAFTVGLLHALHALKGMMVSKKTLAEQAIFVEQTLLAENVGVQDQIQTAFGGLNRVEIRPDGAFSVEPIVIPETRLRELESRIVLFYTGVARHASAVAGEKIKAIPKKTTELHQMRALVDEATNILTGTGSLDDFGRLMHDAWEIKRHLASSVAPAFVNEIYDAARAAGAIGGKVLGAGGGGFMAFFVAPDGRQRLLDALGRLLSVPVEFERTGSQLIFYEPDAFNGAEHHRRDYVRYGLSQEAPAAPVAASAPTPVS